MLDRCQAKKSIFYNQGTIPGTTEEFHSERHPVLVAR